ncbi:hypothetical protein SAMN05444166_8447 [Singulisphaera sp. GP187]|nr:hypothetical protein SAMN05444166_8447 [Singulisphaera sp. GP187]
MTTLLNLPPTNRTRQPFLGTFSARLDKRGQFQQWARRQLVARKSFSGRALLRLLELPLPPKVSALSTSPGIGGEKIPIFAPSVFLEGCDRSVLFPEPVDNFVEQVHTGSRVVPLGEGSGGMPQEMTDVPAVRRV